MCREREASSSVKKVLVSSSSLNKPTLKSALSSESIRAYHSPDLVLIIAEPASREVVSLTNCYLKSNNMKDSSKCPLQFLKLSKIPCKNLVVFL